jgi:uncharacterized protein YdaU (DUF1376 family)
MANLPYYTLYPSDFDTDERVRLMEDDELGLYIRCMNHAWVNDGLPEDPDLIRRAFRDSVEAFSRKWVRVSECFPIATDGRRRNSRQEIERQRAQEKVENAKERGKKGAKARWDASSNAQAMEEVLPKQCGGSAQAMEEVLPKQCGGSVQAMAPASDSDSDSVGSSRKGSAEGKVRQFPGPTDAEQRQQHANALWADAGFEGKDQAEAWWTALVARHPNRNQNRAAYGRWLELIQLGQFNRTDFERWYEEQVPIWGEWEKRGIQATNLRDVFHDTHWRFPAPAARKPAVDYSDPRRYGPQGD